jgi:cytochrome c1
MLVLNPNDLDRRLWMVWAHAHHPAAQMWLKTIAKDYLLEAYAQDTGGTDWDDYANWSKEFLRYEKGCKDPFIHVPKPLPAWAAKSLQKGEPVYVFNAVQPRRREFWKTLIKIVHWFNRNGPEPTDTNYAQLSFPEAEQKAVKWLSEL